MMHRLLLIALVIIATLATTTTAGFAQTSTLDPLADEPALFARHLDEVSDAAARAEAVHLAGADAAAVPHQNGSRAMTAKQRIRQVRAWRAKSSSRKLFTEHFSFPRYVERLDGIATGLVSGEKAPAVAPTKADKARGGPGAHEAAGAPLGSYQVQVTTSTGKRGIPIEDFIVDVDLPSVAGMVRGKVFVNGFPGHRISVDFEHDGRATLTALTGSSGDYLFEAAAAGVGSISIASGNITCSVATQEVTVIPRSIVTAASASTRSGWKPARPSASDSAIAKQPACAAASSSSGLVPGPLSKREAKE